jgi:hypothetical protein
VISTDSITVIAMTAAAAFGAVRVPGRAATVAMAGVTGLLAALWLGEFASTAVAAVVALVAVVVLAAGLVWLAVGRLRGGASTPRARRRRPRRARDRP